jgi:hypothetical protein
MIANSGLNTSTRCVGVMQEIEKDVNGKNQLTENVG